MAFLALFLKNTKKTPDVIFRIRLPTQEFIWGHLFIAHTKEVPVSMLGFLSVIENI